jgi:hypothetical protein
MTRTSSGRFRAGGPRPTGWLIATGPAAPDESRGTN